MVRTATEADDEPTTNDGRTFGDFTDESFLPEGDAARDVTTATTDGLVSEHGRLATDVTKPHDEEDLRDFRRALLSAVTRELAYRRRSRVVPADHDDAKEAAVELLKARDDVTNVSEPLWVNVEFDSAHVALSSVLAPFEYDTKSVDITNEGGLRVGVRITGFDDQIDNVRRKHFFGEYTTPNVSAGVLE